MTSTVQFVAKCLITAALTMTSGCSKPIPTPTSTPARTAKVITAAAAVPITAADVDAFARSLEEAIVKGDVAACNRLMDYDAILDEAMAQPDSPGLDSARRGFKTGALTQLQKESNGLLTDVFTAVRNGGSWKMLRSDLQHRPPQALFRLRLGVGKGMNYLRLSLGRDPQGRVVAQDMFNFISGERVTETLRRVWLTLVRETAKSGIEKLVLPKDAFVTHIDEFKQAGEMVRSGKHAEALAIIRKFPSELQKEKSVLVMRLTAAQNISEDEYIQVIDDWRRLYPKDSSLDFIAIDGNLIRKRYDDSLKCIERLRKATGEDAALDVLQGNVLVQAQRLDEARKFLDIAIRTEPDLPEAYFLGLSLSLIQKKFGDTAHHLTELAQRCAIELQAEDLQKDPDYADFIKSPDYAKWRESLAGGKDRK